MRWKRNPLYIPVEKRGLPTEKREGWESGESEGALPAWDTGPQFGARARVAIAIVSIALIVFWIARGTYVIAGVMFAGLVVSEVVMRRHSGR